LLITFRKIIAKKVSGFKLNDYIYIYKLKQYNMKKYENGYNDKISYYQYKV